jgi:hypothetical protein
MERIGPPGAGAWLDVLAAVPAAARPAANEAAPREVGQRAPARLGRGDRPRAGGGGAAGRSGRANRRRAARRPLVHRGSRRDRHLRRDCRGAVPHERWKPAQSRPMRNGSVANRRNIARSSSTTGLSRIYSTPTSSSRFDGSALRQLHFTWDRTCPRIERVTRTIPPPPARGGKLGGPGVQAGRRCRPRAPAALGRVVRGGGMTSVNPMMAIGHEEL